MEIESDPEIYKVQFIILGDSAVGKTAFIHRYVYNKFVVDIPTTLSISFEVKKITYKGKNYHLNIWDTAGQERYRAIISKHYKGKHGIILTIDLSEPDFKNIDYWLDQIEINAQKDMPVILVGTKKDLTANMDLDNFRAFASEKQLPFVATSAKTNENIDSAIEILLNEVLYRDINLPVLENKNLKEVSNIKKFEKKRGCC